MILAKPIVKSKFWILQENGKKVGFLQHGNIGTYKLQIGNKASIFDSIQNIKAQSQIAFEESEPKEIKKQIGVKGFQTDSKPYNPAYHYKLKIPIFTKTAASLSWFAAGYYQININNAWVWQFCPKLLLLQRNEFRGPFTQPQNELHQA